MLPNLLEFNFRTILFCLSAHITFFSKNGPIKYSDFKGKMVFPVETDNTATCYTNCALLPIALNCNDGFWTDNTAAPSVEADIQVKTYLHSERLRLKFCPKSVTLHGFGRVAHHGWIQMEPLAPNVIYYYTSQEAVLD